MRRILSFSLAGCMLLTIAAPAGAYTPAVVLFPNLRSDPLFDEWTYQALQDVRVDVNWHGVDLRRALQDLTLASPSAYPAHAPIDFLFMPTSDPRYRARTISLRERQAPLIEVLEFLAQAGPYTLKVHRNLVFLEAPGG